MSERARTYRSVQQFKSANVHFDMDEPLNAQLLFDLNCSVCCSLVSNVQVHAYSLHFVFRSVERSVESVFHAYLGDKMLTIRNRPVIITWMC